MLEKTLESPLDCKEIQPVHSNKELDTTERLSTHVVLMWGFPGGSVVKNMPANTGDMGLILGWEDPLEWEMETHPSILAWEIPQTVEPGGLQSMGSQT